MCGISILIDQRNKEIDPDILKKINNKIRHRGPDDEGYYYGEQFGFGHRRLSILDLTEAGHQPMSYKGNWITFNGEVYNYIELKNELIELGHHFITATDTEVILAAFDQWGVESFKKMNGMWAFAIFDPHKNEIVICRDHFGIKPLFYTSHDHFFAAGSEIKQFTELPKFSAILNKDIAVDFLATGLLNHTEETFFKGVNELRAGHYLVYNLNSHEITKVNWYNLSEERKDYVESYTDAVNTVEELFRDSIKLRMRSDVTVGSCLSGGIDSSAIVSSIHANKLANNEFATITSCFEDKKFDEQKFSDLIVQSTGFRSCKVYPVLEELFNEKVLDRMVYHHDQPFSSASNYNQFRIFEEARNEGLIVMMDGQGADEYFLGYPEF
ncbi:MAG TPA: asparagine synthase (glutamine-hydrolyzing), partial [Segetibacter sp.]